MKNISVNTSENALESLIFAITIYRRKSIRNISEEMYMIYRFNYILYNTLTFILVRKRITQLTILIQQIPSNKETILELLCATLLFDP